MQHDAELVAEVRAWLRKAAVDLRAAEHERTAKPPITEDMVFHCQQLAEKTLKAFLCWHDLPFRKTHNLIELGEACVTLDKILELVLRRAAILTEYAWRFRYPGDPEKPTIEETDTALALARDVYDAVVTRLPEAARP